MPVSTRPITPADAPFLHRVYASTRQEELAVLDWTELEKAEFLQMQFRAQHMFYLERFPSAQFDIILLDGQAAGRLYLDRRADEFRIIDIALLPEYRSRGIGTSLLRSIQAEAGAAGLPVRIHVERNNPALRLYHRLGFGEINENGVYYLMEWVPGQGG